MTMEQFCRDGSVAPARNATHSVAGGEQVLGPRST